LLSWIMQFYSGFFSGWHHSYPWRNRKQAVCCYPLRSIARLFLRRLIQTKNRVLHVRWL
jgi:hypothetical protein